MMWKIFVILSVAAVAQSCRVIEVKANGVEVPRTLHPSQVLIENFVTYEQKYLCSGVLVSADYVLTTRECVFGTLFLNVHVYAYKLRNEFESEREIYRVSGDSIAFRDDYDGFNFLNDVALVKLPVTLKLAERNYAIAELPILSDTLDEGRVGESIGWGLLNYKDDNAAAYKQKQTMRVLSDEACRAAFPGKWTDESMYKGRVCIQRESGVNCVSDVGSPFFIGDVLYGLQSFGQVGACEDFRPNGVQEVRYHAGWIDLIITA